MRAWPVAFCFLTMAVPGSLGAQAGEISPGSGARSAWRQEEQVLRLEDGCRDCKLISEEVLRILGSDGDLGFANELLATALDSQGRYWMAFGPSVTVNVVDGEGQIVGLVGRSGEGPGEFSFLTSLVPVADSVFVFDAGNQRVTAVGPDFHVERSFPLVGQVFNGVLIGWPRMVVNAIVPTSRAAGYPFHILNLDTGAIEKSFGGLPGGDFSPRDLPLMIGHIALHPNGREVWTVSRARFKLQRWTLDGEPLQSFTPDPDWFPTHGTDRIGDPDTPPDPVVSAITFSGEDMLIFFSVARSDWRTAWRDLPRSENPHPSPDDLPSIRKLRQSRVALIDLKEGMIIRVWDHDLFPSGWSHAPDTLVEVGDELVPVLSFKRIRIDRKEPNSPRTVPPCTSSEE